MCCVEVIVVLILLSVVYGMWLMIFCVVGLMMLFYLVLCELMNVLLISSLVVGRVRVVWGIVVFMEFFLGNGGVK